MFSKQFCAWTHLTGELSAQLVGLSIVENAARNGQTDGGGLSRRGRSIPNSRGLVRLVSVGKGGGGSGGMVVHLSFLFKSRHHERVKTHERAVFKISVPARTLL